MADGSPSAASWLSSARRKKMAISGFDESCQSSSGPECSSDHSSFRHSGKALLATRRSKGTSPSVATANARQAARAKSGAAHSSNAPAVHTPSSARSSSANSHQIWGDVERLSSGMSSAEVSGFHAKACDMLKGIVFNDVSAASGDCSEEQPRIAPLGRHEAEQFLPGIDPAFDSQGSLLHSTGACKPCPCDGLYDSDFGEDEEEKLDEASAVSNVEKKKKK